MWLFQLLVRKFLITGHDSYHRQSKNEGNHIHILENKNYRSEIEVFVEIHIVKLHIYMLLCDCERLHFVRFTEFRLGISLQQNKAIIQFCMGQGTPKISQILSITDLSLQFPVITCCRQVYHPCFPVNIPTS